MTLATAKDIVTLVDMRAAAADYRLDNQPTGRIVVANKSSSTAKHSGIYRVLRESRLTVGVIYVIIDDDHSRHAKRPTLPFEVKPKREGMLWIGDPHGTKWDVQNSSASPYPPGPEPTALELLLKSLMVPEVFDAVLDELTGFDNRAGIPGISAVTIEPNVDDLNRLFLRALHNFNHGSPSDIAASQGSTSTYPFSDVLTGGRAMGDVSRSRAAAGDPKLAAHIGQLEDHILRLRSPQALFGADRPSLQLGAAAISTTAQAKRYHAAAKALVHSLDSELRQSGGTSGVPVAPAGVPTPEHADGDSTVTAIRRYATEQLHRHLAIQPVISILRRAQLMYAPPSLNIPLEQLSAAEPPPLKHIRFQPWAIPPSFWIILVAIPSVALAALGPQPVGWAASLLTVVWWSAAGCILQARRPLEGGEAGFGKAVLPALAYASLGILGVLLGLLATYVFPTLSGGSEPVQALVVAIVFSSSLIVPVIAWRAAVKRYELDTDLEALTTWYEHTMTRVETVICKDWIPHIQRRNLSDAMVSVANTLDSSSVALTTFPSPSGLADSSSIPVIERLLRQDLVRTFLDALSPVWSTISLHSDLQSTFSVAKDVESAVRRYWAYLLQHGYTNPSPSFRDETGDDQQGLEDLARSNDRRQIIDKQWVERPNARLAVRADAYGEMTQLCTVKQLGYLRNDVPIVIRFAPESQRSLFDQSASIRTHDGNSVIWTQSSGVAGSMRVLAFPQTLESSGREPGRQGDEG